VFKVSFEVARDAVDSIAGHDAAASANRAETLGLHHPDAKGKGCKPIVTALSILALESHTLDLCSLAAALHRRRERAFSRRVGLQGMFALLSGLSNESSDGMTASAFQVAALSGLPGCLRTRSAFDRRLCIENGSGFSLEPGVDQSLHVEAGLLGAPTFLVNGVRKDFLRIAELSCTIAEQAANK